MAFKFAVNPEESETTTTGASKSMRALPPQPKPFDLEAAKKDFEPYRKQIEEMKRQAAEFEITDDQSNEQAITMMGQARNLFKSINSLKDGRLKPHNKFRTNLIAFAKAFSVPVEQAVGILKQKSEGYAYKKLLKQRKKDKEEREKAIKRQQDLDAEADEAGVEKVQIAQVPVDLEEKVQTRTESGSSLSITLEWVGVILDPDKVERSLCSPDQKKIDEKVKGGLRESPGIDIKEVPQSRLRA